MVGVGSKRLSYRIMGCSCWYKDIFHMALSIQYSFDIIDSMVYWILCLGSNTCNYEGARLNYDLRWKFQNSPIYAADRTFVWLVSNINITSFFSNSIVSILIFEYSVFFIQLSYCVGLSIAEVLFIARKIYVDDTHKSLNIVHYYFSEIIIS